MNRNAMLAMTGILALSGLVSIAVSDEISVGVKQGDWFELRSVYTGDPPSPYGIWAKIEIFSVHGTAMTVKGMGNMSDGTQEPVVWGIDVATGTGPYIIIPANLKDGDTFNSGMGGNTTIDGVETRTYAGASRTVVYANLSKYGWQSSTAFWDQSTGVLVEETRLETDYSLFIFLDRTNMWQPQPFGTLSPILPYILIVVAVIAVTFTVFFVMQRRKKARQDPLRGH